MIPIYKCKDGYVYRLNARHIKFGVWEAEIEVFRGIRNKFGKKFLDTEDHWDAGPPYGTAKPIEEMEKFPGGDLYAHLNGIEKCCE